MLVTSIFIVLISVEYLAQIIHDHRKVTLAIEGGVRQALAIRSSESSRQVLFAGNSLIFEDLRQPALQQVMGAAFTVYTAGVPGSTYSDWRFGLRSLFARGAQPDVVVFGISPVQFLRAPEVTPVPVSLLWSAREIFDYDRERRLNLTKLSELFFEHYSVYFSLRDTVRIYVRKFIPGYEAMLDSWAKSSAVARVEAGPGTETAFAEQLSRLATNCGPHARLMVMIAPTNQLADQTMEPSLKAAADKLNIPIIEPIGEHQWPITNFQEDGYHLNAPAANEFSMLVAAELKRTLDGSAGHNTGQ